MALSIQNSVAQTFSIYPNPNEGTFQVILLNEASGKLEVTDINGKMVFQHSVLGANNDIYVDRQLVPGMYFVKFIAKNGYTSVRKVIVVKN